MSELEDQFPSQGLIYNLYFGVVIMVIGVFLLLVFNFKLISNIIGL